VSFTPVEPAAFPAHEAEDARIYWAGLGVQPGYTIDRHWRTFVARRVLALEPGSVLEFGCNCGRNLFEIAKRGQGVRLTGVDVNEAAVAHGRKLHRLDLRTADQRWLFTQRDGAFDLAFTVSVLDHIPDPWPVVTELIRVAAAGVLLLEPWLGREGRVVQRNGRYRSDAYCYSWDYARFLAGFASTHEVGSEPYPLNGVMWGDRYSLFSVLRRDTDRGTGSG
jgi:SAM-dependent methyltransferase